MNRPAKIAVAGSINMDLVVTAERLPVPGETVMGRQFRMIPGGKGANQAVAAVRLGAQVSMIGCVGGDTFGAQMLEGLRGEGIDTAFVATAEETSSGVALIQVQGGGDNSIVVVPGANAALTPERVSQAEEAIRGADVLLVQLEIPLESVRRAVEIAHRHGVKVILDPAPAAELPLSLLRQIDLITPNETEALILTGGAADASTDASAQDGRTVSESIRQLKERTGGAGVVVTCGGKGVLYDLDGKQGAHPAYRVDAADTTAAGDSFNAGLAVRWSEGAPLEEAVRFASKVGALTVTRFGAQASLPARDEVEAFEAPFRDDPA
ncbi:ribokinase [Paenibacillus chitinolyticus]|uniref:ribokinase n=1 Tax=Paenibacillus chitinolyticus TaxID=79263 RepID=UPI001C4696F1|nr:ribokinase [Paenibacillus chitinolyticus]MBV6716923.1 ribokinase [Paenibacillus chitinolyticus]